MSTMAENVKKVLPEALEIEKLHGLTKSEIHALSIPMLTGLLTALRGKPGVMDRTIEMMNAMDKMAPSEKFEDLNGSAMLLFCAGITLQYLAETYVNSTEDERGFRNPRAM